MASNGVEIEMEEKVAPTIQASEEAAYETGTATSSFLQRQQDRSDADEEAVPETPWQEILGAFFIFYGLLTAMFAGLLSASLAWGQSVSWMYLVLFIFTVIGISIVVAVGKWDRIRAAREAPKEE